MTKTPAPKKTNKGKLYEKPLKINASFDEVLKIASDYTVKKEKKKS